MNTIKQRLLFLIVVLASFTVVGWCQGNLGGITGRVTDPSGGAIPEAAIVLTGLDTGTALKAGTSGDGIYSVSSVAPGRYRINVTKTGFKVFTQEPIFISTATVMTLDINLTVGTVTETVSVTAQAAALQTTSAEVGTVMPTQAMMDLPISMGGNATAGASGRRQIENFTFLTPGVQGTQWAKNINGSQSFSQEVLIDGLSMSQMGAPGFLADSSPPYESVSEFKMQNTLYPAEYGQGYGIENFTLKSGGSKFHGDLFEFVRNDKFDARGFYGATKNILRQNEFGATIGGPLSIPKVYNSKDRTFFFASYSGFRLRGGVPSAGFVTLPTAAERTGDFSGQPFPIFDPVCGYGTAGAHRCTSDETRPQFNYQGTLNRIDPARLSAVALRATALLPANDNSSYFNNYVNRSSQPTLDDDFTVKIDHNITDKQRISGAYWKVAGNATVNGPVTGELNPDLRLTPTKSGGLRVNHFYTISPTVLNNIGFGYSWSSPTWTYWQADTRHGNQTLQIPGIPADAPGFPELYFSGNGGYNNLGNTVNQGFDPQFMQHFSVVDNLTWVKGRHQLKFGGSLRRRGFTFDDVSAQAGSFTFSSASTTQLNDPNNSAQQGNSYASFLLGETWNSYRQVSAPIFHTWDTMFAMYGEDVIKVTSKLTLTLGLRYELPKYAQERTGQWSYMSLTEPNTAAGGLPGALQFFGNGAGRNGNFNLFGSYHKSISPRLALAYQIDKKTVVRMGYGIFRLQLNYGRVDSTNLWGVGFGAFPSVSTLDSGVHPAFNLDQGFPASTITLPNLDPTQLNNSSISYINASAGKPSFNQSWTVALQRELPFNINLDVAYVASNTTGLPAGLENINQLNPSALSLGNDLIADISCIAGGATGTCPRAFAAGVRSPYAGFSGTVGQAMRPYPQYLGINDMYQPTGYNTYNSLQVRAQKRYSNGLSFLGSYTFSKNIGVAGADSFGDIYGGGGTGGLDTFNQKREKSLIPWDQTHVFTFSWSYALPFGRGKKFLANTNPVLNQLLGGWQLNSIESYSSGNPIGISGGTGLPLFGGGNRPNWDPSAGNGRSSVSMSSFDPNVDKYLVITPWSKPAPFTFGNGPRTQPNLRAPAYADEAFSVFKRFSLRSESRYLEFRAEMFDLFNRVVFGGPSGNINDPTSFGTIGGAANTPRTIQFALKLVF